MWVRPLEDVTSLHDGFVEVEAAGDVGLFVVRFGGRQAVCEAECTTVEGKLGR